MSRGCATLDRGFGALSIRNYRIYWVGQGVSRTGTWMQQVSLPWLVLALGGTPLQLGIVAALEFAPSTVLAPFGGVLADRVDKRRALLVTQAAAALQVIVLVILLAAGLLSIPLVMLLSFLLGLVNAADMPLRQSVAAELVPRSLLANAIALNSMAFNSARVIGPAVAGVTIAIGAAAFGSNLAGIGFNFGLNALSYAGSLISLLLMDGDAFRVPPPPGERPRVLASLREGIAYAARTPIVLWSLILLGGVSTFGLNFRVLLPIFAQDELGLDASGFGALYAATGLGALFGAVMLAFLHERRVLPFMLIGGAAFVAAELLLAAAPVALVAVPLVFAAGLASMLMINTVNATVQSNVSDALRGRVMALYVTVFAGSTPIGGIFAGLVAEHADARAGFWWGAIASLAVLLLVAWRMRAALRAGRLGKTRLGGLEPTVDAT